MFGIIPPRAWWFSINTFAYFDSFNVLRFIRNHAVQTYHLCHTLPFCVLPIDWLEKLTKSYGGLHNPIHHSLPIKISRKREWYSCSSRCSSSIIDSIFFSKAWFNPSDLCTPMWNNLRVEHFRRKSIWFLKSAHKKIPTGKKFGD